jgi:hypothetical protein
LQSLPTVGPQILLLFYAARSMFIAVCDIQAGVDGRIA